MSGIHSDYKWFATSLRSAMEQHRVIIIGFGLNIMIGAMGLFHNAEARPFDQYYSDGEVSKTAPMIEAYEGLFERSEEAFNELDEYMNDPKAQPKTKVQPEQAHTDSHEPDLKDLNRSPQNKIYTKQSTHSTEHVEPQNLLINPKKSQRVIFETEVLRLVNQKRALGGQCGSEIFNKTHPLRANKKLAIAARNHALAMIKGRFFSHNGLSGDSPKDRIIATGYLGSAWGENIAAGQRTPEIVVTEWMNSPGHCRNILNPLFKELGVSFVFEPKSPYKTYWVQAFGRPR